MSFITITYIVISTAQTDLGLRIWNFFSKINNKLPTFSKITQVWQCLKIVFIWSKISLHTEFQLQIMFYTFQTSDIEHLSPKIETKYTSY